MMVFLTSSLSIVSTYSHATTSGGTSSSSSASSSSSSSAASDLEVQLLQVQV